MVSFATFAGRNINGLSMLAINAPAADAARELSAETDVLSYEKDVPLRTMFPADGGRLVDQDGNYLTSHVHPDRRCIVITQSTDCEWTAVLRSIDFVEVDDFDWANKTAKKLSETLQTKSLAGAGRDEWECSVFVNGRTVQRANGWNVSQVSALFDSYSIDIPLCTTAGDPDEIWATEMARHEISYASLLTLSVTRPETKPTSHQVRLPLHPMFASTCLDIVKLRQFVPCEVNDDINSYRSTIVDVVFDPLRIDEVDSKFRADGYHFDDGRMNVIAVNDDRSILLWGGPNAVFHLQKGERMENALLNHLAFNDILDLTFPFNIKNRKVEIDELVSQIQQKYGD